MNVLLFLTTDQKIALWAIIIPAGLAVLVIIGAIWKYYVSRNVKTPRDSASNIDQGQKRIDKIVEGKIALYIEKQKLLWPNIKNVEKIKGELRAEFTREVRPQIEHSSDTVRPELNIFYEEIKDKNYFVFAGTGVNTGTGIPGSSQELLKSLYDIEPLEDVEFGKIEEKEYPNIARRIYGSLCSKQKEEEYYKIIKDNLKADNAPFSTQHTQIWKTCNRVVTTNFDNSFERAFNDLHEEKPEKLEKMYLDSLDSRKLEEKFSITYLHGRIDEKAIIFKKEDYEIFYPSVSSKQNGSDILVLCHTSIDG